MAYRCDGTDSANKLTKTKRNITGGVGFSLRGTIKTKRIINTGVRVSGGGGGSVRPATGQILPRGK
jgi:hypothetical protein